MGSKLFISSSCSLLLNILEHSKMSLIKNVYSDVIKNEILTNKKALLPTRILALHIQF